MLKAAGASSTPRCAQNSQKRLHVACRGARVSARALALRRRSSQPTSAVCAWAALLSSRCPLQPAGEQQVGHLEQTDAAAIALTREPLHKVRHRVILATIMHRVGAEAELGRRRQSHLQP